jgi:hypothetical protein
MMAAILPNPAVIVWVIEVNDIFRISELVRVIFAGYNFLA